MASVAGLSVLPGEARIMRMKVSVIAWYSNSLAVGDWGICCWIVSVTWGG